MTSTNPEYMSKLVTATATLEAATKAAVKAKPAANANVGDGSPVNSIADNPLYKIVVSDKHSSTEEKVGAIKAFLGFSPDNDKENAAKIDTVAELLEYIQARQKNNAVKQIQTVADESSSKYQSALEKVIDGLQQYNTLLSPLQSALEVLQQRRNPGELRQFIVSEKERVDHYESEQRRIARFIEDTEADIITAEATEKSRRSGVSGFFLRMRETVGETEETKRHKARLAELQAQKSKLDESKPTEEELASLKAAQEVMRVLDMGKGSSFQQTVGDAARQALSLIENMDVTINSAESGLLKARDQIRGLHRGNDEITIAMTVLREGLTASLDDNNGRVQEFTALMNDETLTDLVEKKRREIRQMGATRFVAALSSVHNEASTGAAQAEQQKAVLVDLDRNNTEQLEGARNVKSQGIATTADKLGVLLNSIAMQGSAETARAANAILVEMRASAMKVLQRNMEKTPQIYEDRNKALIEMADTMLSLRDTMDTTSAQIVEELRKRSTHVGNVNSAAGELRKETVRYTGLEHEAILAGALPVDGSAETGGAAPVRPAAKAPAGSGDEFSL